MRMPIVMLVLVQSTMLLSDALADGPFRQRLRNASAHRTIGAPANSVHVIPPGPDDPSKVDMFYCTIQQVCTDAMGGETTLEEEGTGLTPYAARAMALQLITARCSSPGDVLHSDYLCKSCMNGTGAPIDCPADDPSPFHLCPPTCVSKRSSCCVFSRTRCSRLAGGLKIQANDKLNRSCPRTTCRRRY